MSRRTFLVATAVLVAVCGAANAEDVTGAEKILCAGVEAIVCDTSGECEFGRPWSWNMPEFLEIHLDKKVLRTTPGAPRLRETPILTLKRADGQVFLQGVENGRAFSFVIDEVSGGASIAIAADELTISVFAACTPLPTSE